jgi:hypothetical protein
MSFWNIGGLIVSHGIGSCLSALHRRIPERLLDAMF